MFIKSLKVSHAVNENPWAVVEIDDAMANHYINNLQTETNPEGTPVVWVEATQEEFDNRDAEVPVEAPVEAPCEPEVELVATETGDAVAEAEPVTE